MLPAPGQGALAIQCRASDGAVLDFLAALNDSATQKAVSAERAFLAGLGAGCSTPVAAYASVEAGHIHLTGLVMSEDGKAAVKVSGSGISPLELGGELARAAMRQAADKILRVKSSI